MGTQGNHHSEFMHLFFQDLSRGIDLKNIEIKESTKSYQKFTVLSKDMASKYLLFYDHKSQTWAIAKTNSFPEVVVKRSFRLSQVLEHAYYVTKDDFEVLWEVYKIIEDHSLMNISKEDLEEMFKETKKWKEFLKKITKKYFKQEVEGVSPSKVALEVFD